MLTFDTLDYSERLQAVGFTSEQAKVQAESLLQIITSNLVTKSDIKELEVSTKADIKELAASIEALAVSTKADIAELAASTKSDIAELAASTKADIAELAASTKADIAELAASTKADNRALEADIARQVSKLETRFLVCLGGASVAIVGILATIIKLG